MRTGFPPDAFTSACFTSEPFTVLRRQVSFTQPFKSFSLLLLSWAAILLLQFVHVIKYLKPFLFFPSLLFSPTLALSMKRLGRQTASVLHQDSVKSSRRLHSGLEPEHCTCRCENRGGGGRGGSPTTTICEFATAEQKINQSLLSI